MDLKIKPHSHTIAVTIFHELTFFDLENAQTIGQKLQTSPGANLGYWFVYDDLYFSLDGERLLLFEPRRLTVFNTGLGTWQEIGCRLAGRNLTEAEWQVYLSDLPYEKICPGLP